MSALNPDKIISALKLVPTGAKGWYHNPTPDGLICPNCHKGNGRLAIIFGKVCSWKCVRCGAHGRLEGLLFRLKRSDLVPKYKTVVEEEILEKRNLIEKRVVELDLQDLPECPLPVLFKRISSSEYLNSRGCTPDIYNNWTIGVTNAFKKLKGYIIFIIKENNKCVGWVARSTKSKKEIERLEKEEGKFFLRWRNSDDTDFSKIVFGIDEINENTEVVIIVEGLTSKMNTDIQLELFSDDYMKCVCTFGKKISEIQILKIARKGKNIKQIILFYDSDAVKASKQTSFMLQQYFKDVRIAFGIYYNKDGSEKDAGDLTLKEFEEIFSKLQTPFMFYNNVLEKKALN